jgi:hypothetical protein
MNTTDTTQVEDSTIPVGERLVSASMPDIDARTRKTRYDNRPIPETYVKGPFTTSRAQRRAAWRMTFRGRPFQGPTPKDGYPWALPCGDADLVALETLRRQIQSRLDKDGRYLPR